MKTQLKKRKIKIEVEVEYNEVQFLGNWIPKTLYKYRDWGNPKHKTILIENSIWIPDSFGFNDPFDCSIPIDYSLVQNNKEMKEKLFKMIVIPPRDGNLPNLYEESIQRALFERRFSDPNFLNDFPKAVLNENKKRTGVFTVTPINNNILMWAHYADSHKGFCLGLDTIKLFNSSPFAGDYVDYEKDYPLVSPMDDDNTALKKMVFTKSHHWEYELEYRMTLVKFTNQLIKVNPDVYTEFIFGSRMPEPDRIEIKRILKDKYPHIKIFNCVPHSNNFEITIIEET